MFASLPIYDEFHKFPYVRNIHVLQSLVFNHVLLVSLMYLYVFLKFETIMANYFIFCVIYCEMTKVCALPY